jgi:asparagine synthase (glutamine-hydrolysing)
LTYLKPDRLITLERCAREMSARGVPGDFVEAGVALGGSGILLARLMSEERSFHGFDVFGMIPPPSSRDPEEVQERYAVISSGRSRGLRGGTYYGYRDDLFAEVVEVFGEFGVPVGERVHLHKGLFEEALNLHGPVALAHVDCDWHDPVSVCLERITPWLAPGGLIVLDDYNDWGGCRDATDRFVEQQPQFELVVLGSNVAVRHREDGSR